jgi:hypothetical protein
VQLLVVVLHREELLDEVLSLLVELELPDSIVVESRTGLELLERDLPIFAGLRSLMPGGIGFCRVVLCLVPGDARQALSALEALGPRTQKAGEPASTAFLLPIADARFF